MSDVVQVLGEDREAASESQPLDSSRGAGFASPAGMDP